MTQQLEIEWMESQTDGGRSGEYAAFTDKFKVRKTTDDCYTPPPVYEAVERYVRERYDLPDAHFVRPFYPGGDYENFDYAPNDVVVDNPPFSMMSEILRHYKRRGIPFFLFCPGLILGTTQKAGCTLIAAAANITYDNGAVVVTNFATSLEPGVLARSDPGLHDAVQAAADACAREGRRTVPKYTYPDAVLTAAALNYFAVHGTAYSVRAGSAIPISVMDAQRAEGKAIFGGGLLLSERAAAERAAAERAAAERAAATVWELSSHELELVRILTEGDENGD